MIDRYTTDEMAFLWSGPHKYKLWLDIELTVCSAMEQMGIVPSGTSDKIGYKLQHSTICPHRIDELESVVHHYVIAFLDHIDELYESTGGSVNDTRWLHYGMTGSDLEDTALSLILLDTHKLISEKLSLLINTFVDKVIKYRRVLMIGRTHGMHAEPITFGLVLAGHLAELKRAQYRLQQVKKEICIGKITGAVGTYSHLSPAIEDNVLAELGLYRETVPTQVIARDRHASYINTLVLIAVAIERFAINFRHWQRTEISEVAELYTDGRKGSSAMPHKHNPITGENLCGLARMVRALVTPALENVALWHERDLSHTSVERMILPDITYLIDFMLARTYQLVKNLVPNEKRMSENLAMSVDRCYSGFVLAKLIEKGLSRSEAYNIIQLASMSADFMKFLASNTVVQKYLSIEELDECFNVEVACRHIDSIIDRCLFT